MGVIIWMSEYQLRKCFQKDPKTSWWAFWLCESIVPWWTQGILLGSLELDCIKHWPRPDMTYGPWGWFSEVLNGALWGLLWQTQIHELLLFIQPIISKTDRIYKVISHVYRYTCAGAIVSRASELRSQKAILSVDRIRYRYGRLVAVHSTDIANRSGHHMARRSLGDWRQYLGRHGTNHERHSTSCTMQKSRIPRKPHTESACGHGTRRKGDRIPPDREYAQHGQQNVTPSIFSLPLDTTHCLFHHIARGTCMQFNMFE
jgi:hypothetical protein